MDDLAIGLGLGWYAIFIISLTCHEAAHGLAARLLGDPTAYHHGLVTLDPLPHLRRSPFGTVIIPLVTYALNGWMVGWASAPYDPFWARENRKKSAIMSIAGPAANLVLLIIALVVMKIGLGAEIFRIPESRAFEKLVTADPGIANSIATLMSIMFTLNLVLLIFNLIPVPPLDGSGILLFFLNQQKADKYNDLCRQPGFMILGIIIAWNLFGVLFLKIFPLSLKLLYL